MSVGRIASSVASIWLVFWLSLTAVYVHFGSLAFAGLSILLGAVGWLVWLANRRRWPVFGLEFALPAGLFTLFFVWLALSGSWSGQGPDTALRLGGQMLLAASIPIYLLTRGDALQSRIASIFVWTSLIGALVLAIDVASGFAINLFFDPPRAGLSLEKRLGDIEMNIGRGHVTWALMAPLILGLFATRFSKGAAIAASIAFLSLVLIGTLLNGLTIVPIILAIALPFVWLGYKSSQTGLSLSVGLLASSVLFAPLIGVAARLTGESTLARLPMSWDHRVRMWDYCLMRMMEAPVIGKGLDSSRTMQDEFTTRIGVDWPIVSLHPHNVGLQTWMETGLIGALLLTVAIVSLMRPLQSLAGSDPWRGAALSGTVAAMAVAGAVTVGAWQYWWWGLAAVTLSLVSLIHTRKA